MKIRYFGHSCFLLEFENGPALVTDPFDPSVTYPPCRANCDAALVSHDHFDHNYTASLTGDFMILREPGVYTVGNAKITAIPSFHDDQNGALRGENLLMRIECDGLSIAHLGDLGHMPNEAQLNALRGLDVLLLPIGGTYTIDTPQALELMRMLQPRHAIAMHFKTDAYEIDISRCDAFARETHAAFMPREIEITRENAAALPPVMILSYK